MKYTFHIVDVFSSTPFGGNQLAVLPDAAGISTEGIQKIAREFNFGETTFVLPKKDPASTCRVRIFTPRTELDVAGHPSVGTACALVMKQHERLKRAASRALPAIHQGVKMLRTLFSATILTGALAGSAMAQAPDAGCALPSEPKGIPAALDAAISGPADKDRACMKALLIPEARLMFVSLGADGAPTYRLETLDDWIARVKARGHAMLEEKQLKYHIERYGNIAHLWSSYALHSDGKQVSRGIHSIQAIKEASGWRVMVIMVQAESATAPLPKEYLP
jgi:hypothetical protein